MDRLFDAALDREPSEWSAFLEAECPEALRPDVERLLDAIREDPASQTMMREGGALLGSLGASLADGLDTEAPLRPGDRVGPYRVVRELGRGGMAVVYLAERSDGVFEQKVALKVALRAERQAGRRARFELERQILAGLHHPNIARLLDGGLTEDGHPYFALEWVDGERIDRYCDRRRLTVEERLCLFVDVGRAVAAAHRSLVVHRDLKPSNVMVADDEDQPRVKLLDFGIAKVLETSVDSPDGAGGLTRTEMLPMTPDYASPEQLAGEPLTTAVDVYQLGMLLYQLLCGTRPFEDVSLVERIARDHTPTRPSQVLARAAAEHVAAARSTAVRSLRRQITGDLETIVLTAMRKEPERRYPSVTALVDDVEAFLDERPIEARGDGLGYRLGKFVRRNRWSTAIVGLSMLVLVAVVAVYTLRLKTERDLAELAQQDAELSRAESQEVADFLVELFGVSKHGAARAETITAVDLLNVGTKEIENKLVDRPLVRARLLRTLGNVYTNLALHGQARPLLEQALDLRSSFLGSDHPDVATSLDDLGRLESELGNLDQAEEIHQRALDIREAALGPDHPDVADSLNSLVIVYWGRGEFDRVEPLLRRCLEIREAAFGEEHASTAASLKNLGVVLRTLGRLDEAVPYSQRSIDAYSAVFGPDDGRVAGALNTLALVYSAQGRHDAAEPLYLRALDIWTRTFGPDHVRTTRAMQNLALLYQAQGRLDEAEELLVRAVEVTRATYGPDHSATAVSHHNLAQNYLLAGRLEEAEAQFRRAVTIKSETNPGHPILARSLVGLGQVLIQSGDLVEARALVLQGLDIHERVVGPEHPDTGFALRALASIEAREGQAEKARTLYRRALAIFEDGDPETYRETVEQMERDLSPPVSS